ncbi:TPR-like protein [Daedalea quercina L-15889]|uniref:TPR-like protein n=1 Tax=Daedalea quercina L-15889 TaxID=1314783 RepID=A0A165NZP7_9APHY|nr:TPR-like protein [Daedalea quercina L-15889]
MCTRTHTLNEYSRNDVAMDLWTRGATAMASGKTGKAIRLFDQCITEDATAVAFFRSRGDAHMTAKNYVAALSDFEQAYDMMEAAPPARVMPMLCKMARCHLGLGSCRPAMRVVHEALSVDPTYKPARALQRRLMCLQEGEEAFRQALANGRQRAARSSWDMCVHVYEEEGCAVPVAVRCWEVDLAVAERDWVDAESTAEKISNEEPGDVGAMLTRINVLVLVDELQAALEQTTAGLRLDPDNASLKTSRARIKAICRLDAQGDAHMDSKDNGAALQVWQHILELVPDGPEDGGGGLLRARFLLKKAKAELKLRQFAEGLGSVNASLKLDASRWDSYLVKGRCHVGLRQRDLAVKDFRTCIRKAEVNESGTSAGRSRKTVTDYYEILGVPPDCTLAEVRKAYKKAMIKYHSDKGGAEGKFKLVKEAYSVLSDPEAGRKL